MSSIISLPKIGIAAALPILLAFLNGCGRAESSAVAHGSAAAAGHRRLRNRGPGEGLGRIHRPL